MAANVETMFYTREKPWHGLGTMVAEAPESRDVFCKTFLHKIAKTFCRSLQLHFVGNCKPGWQSWYLPAI